MRREAPGFVLAAQAFFYLTCGGPKPHLFVCQVRGPEALLACRQVLIDRGGYQN